MAQTPIGQKLWYYKPGVPPNYYEKEAEGKEDIRVQELTAQVKCTINEQKKSP